MKYFSPDPNWKYNSRLTRGDNKWLLYGEGYCFAIELIEKQILEVERSSQDFLIYPYCYLIRHYIEIRLKEIIDEGSKLIGKIENPSIGRHDLSILWKTSHEILKSVWLEEYQEPPSNVYDFVNEFHSIDVKSFGFRYPIDKNGEETLANINEINFKKLSEGFQNVKYYLDGVTDGLAVAKES
jgi:hypothetical protein